MNQKNKRIKYMGMAKETKDKIFFLIKKIINYPFSHFQKQKEMEMGHKENHFNQKKFRLTILVCNT